MNVLRLPASLRRGMGFVDLGWRGRSGGCGGAREGNGGGNIMISTVKGCVGILGCNGEGEGAVQVAIRGRDSSYVT